MTMSNYYSSSIFFDYINSALTQFILAFVGSGIFQSLLLE